MSTNTGVAAAEPGFFGLLAGVWLEPGEAFAHIARRPRFWVPLAALTILQLLFASVWLDRVDLYEYARAQAAEMGKPAPPPSAAAEGGIYRVVKIAIGTSMVTFAPMVAFAMAGLMLFVFAFVLGAEADYRQCLAVVSWASFAVGVVVIPATLLVLALRGDWNVDPQAALATDLSVLFDPAAMPAGLFSAARSLDVVSFWTIYLLAVGMAAVVQRRTRTALTAILVLWSLYVAVKSLLAAAWA